MFIDKWTLMLNGRPNIAILTWDDSKALHNTSHAHKQNTYPYDDDDDD